MGLKKIISDELEKNFRRKKFIFPIVKYTFSTSESKIQNFYLVPGWSQHYWCEPTKYKKTASSTFISLFLNIGVI